MSTPKPVKSLYELVVRQIGVSQAVSVRARRGKVTVQGVEKVVPPTLVYGEDGEYQLLHLQDVLRRWKPARYKSRTADFNAERVANSEVSSFMKLLESYPSMEQEQSEEGSKPHPLAEILYSTMVYQMPTPELQDKLSKMDVILAGQYQAECLEAASKRLAEEQGVFLDQHAVSKKDVGQQAYVADKDGLGIAPRFFAMGYHKAIPLDRIARELGQLKAAERFLNPAPIPGKLNPILAPYVTGLRVAVVWTETSMLDSGDLYPSSVPKLAAKLVQRTEVKNLETIPVEKQKLKAKIFHAGIEIVHEEITVTDELQHGFPCLKLLMPGGVKIAAQLQTDVQAMAEGQPVDLLMDMRTLSSKGAVALLAMIHPEAPNYPTPSLETCWELVKSLPKTEVQVGDVTYQGYVGVIPVIRTRQRYTELSKGSNHIGCDLISLATLGLPFEIRPDLEADYQDLKAFREALANTPGRQQEHVDGSFLMDFLRPS